MACSLYEVQLQLRWKSIHLCWIHELRLTLATILTQHLINQNSVLPHQKIYTLLTTRRRMARSIFENVVSKASTRPLPRQHGQGSLIINVTLGLTCKSKSDSYDSITQVSWISIYERYQSSRVNIKDSISSFGYKHFTAQRKYCVLLLEFQTVAFI